MTAFGKLLRTTAFRMTLAYLFVFALFAAFLLGYFALNTRRVTFVGTIGAVPRFAALAAAFAVRRASSRLAADD